MTTPFSDFLPLQATGDRTFELPVDTALCSALHTLWGGCGLAAAVEAMQRATGRSCAWAAVQYLRPIHPEQVLHLTVELGGEGRRITQAQVSGHVDGQRVLVGHGSLGGEGPTDTQFVQAPQVPGPEQCPVREMPLTLDATGTILERFEQRWAQPAVETRTDGTPGSGRALVWMRLVEPVETSAGALAVLADLAPSAISEALGVMAGGVSLDNTIRFARRGEVAPGGWVLLDVTVEAVVADIAQLSVRAFDRHGTLLAVGGQSAVVRRVAAPRTRR